MSSRKQLKKFSKKVPDPKEITGLIDTLSKASDHACAIMGASVIESVLERILIKSFKYSTPQMVNEIFENKGPLSDFHSKILMATALGLVTPQGLLELNTIKSIRNAFAHSKYPITFDTAEVAQEIDSFLMLNAIRNVKSKNEQIKWDAPNKANFSLMVRLMFILLDATYQRLGGLPFERDLLARQPKEVAE